MALRSDVDMTDIRAHIEENNRRALYVEAKRQQEWFAKHFPIENDVEVRTIEMVDVKKGEPHGNDR